MQAIVFFGSAPFSVPVLKTLLSSNVSVVGVVTQPDKPSGRHLKLTPNPVKGLAQIYNIQAYTDIKDLLAVNLPPDAIGLVAAYGRILGPKTLSKFGGHIYGIHPSLLPKYRGPSPIQQQIIDGLTETGVTILKIDLGVDTGPIMLQETEALLPTDTTTSLGTRLFATGVQLFLANLHSIIANPGTPQNDSLASDTKIFTRNDGFVTWDDFRSTLNTHPLSLGTKLRAFDDWPGVWTIMPNNKRLKLMELSPTTLVRQEGKSVQTWKSLVY